MFRITRYFHTGFFITLPKKIFLFFFPYRNKDFRVLTLSQQKILFFSFYLCDRKLHIMNLDSFLYDNCKVFYDLDNISKHSISELQYILGCHPRLKKSDYVKLAEKNIEKFREHNRALNLNTLNK